MENSHETTNNYNSNNYSVGSQVPFYHSSFSCSSSWSYLSSSSGFGSDCLAEALDLSSDNEFKISNSNFLKNSLNLQQQQQHPPQISQIQQQLQQQDESFIGGSSQSLDSLMDSEVFVNESNLNGTNCNERTNLNCESSFDDLNVFPAYSSQYAISPQSRASLSNDSIQMWQFLLELLEDKRCRHLIRWRSVEKNYQDNEFVIYDPIEIVKQWAVRHAKPNMNYKKFCRILRYYYKNKILQKTAGTL